MQDLLTAEILPPWNTRARKTSDIRPRRREKKDFPPTSLPPPPHTHTQKKDMEADMNRRQTQHTAAVQDRRERVTVGATEITLFYVIRMGVGGDDVTQGSQHIHISIQCPNMMQLCLLEPLWPCFASSLPPAEKLRCRTAR